MSLTRMRVWRNFLTRIGIPNNYGAMVIEEWSMVHG
jgi:hypothetical protein